MSTTPVGQGLGLELGLEPILPKKSLSATSQGSAASAKSRRDEFKIDTIGIRAAPEPEAEAGCLSYICRGICSCLYTVLIAPWVCLFKAIFCSCCEDEAFSFATSSYVAIEAQLGQDGEMIDLYTPDAQGIFPLQHLLQRSGWCNNFSNLVPLLVAKAAPNAEDELRKKVVRCLLGQEDINQRDEIGTPFVQDLFTSRHYGLVVLLIQAGVDVNAKEQVVATDNSSGRQTITGSQRTLLSQVCHHNEVDRVFGKTVGKDSTVRDKQFFEWVVGAPGVLPNQRDRHGRTPLHICMDQNHGSYARILLGCGAVNGNAVDNAGNTPLHLAACSGNLKLVQLISNCIDSHGKYKANLRKVNDRGETALHAIARLKQELVVEAHAQIVTFLTEPREGDDTRHIDVHMRNHEGLMALHVAGLHNNEIVIEALMRGGAGINDRAGKGQFKGQTALHLAATLQHSGLVKMLIGQYNADPTIEDVNGKTPLDRVGEMPIRQNGPYIDQLASELHRHATIIYLAKAMYEKGDHSVHKKWTESTTQANSLRDQIQEANDELIAEENKEAEVERGALSLARKQGGGK